MKSGFDCDLPERLAATGAFGMTAGEIRDVLNPELYIGRCPEQVSRLVEKIRLEIGENKAHNI